MFSYFRTKLDGYISLLVIRKVPFFKCGLRMYLKQRNVIAYHWKISSSELWDLYWMEHERISSKRARSRLETIALSHHSGDIWKGFTKVQKYSDVKSKAKTQPQESNLKEQFIKKYPGIWLLRIWNRATFQFQHCLYSRFSRVPSWAKFRSTCGKKPSAMPVGANRCSA